MARGEVYISMDIEADGPVPGMNSMLSFGAAALDIDKRLLGTFGRNLELLTEAKPDPKTMTEFWAHNDDAWAACRTDPIEPSVAVPEFVDWLRGVCGNARPLFVAYPAAYDFKWIDYYTHRFSGGNPFGFNGCIDAKVLAWAHVGGLFCQFSKRDFPKSWFDKGLPHTHVALDDAVEQGAMFINMLREIRGLSKIETIAHA